MNKRTTLSAEVTDLIYGWAAIARYGSAIPLVIIEEMWSIKQMGQSDDQFPVKPLMVTIIAYLATLVLVEVPGLASGYFMTKGRRGAFLVGLISNVIGICMLLYSLYSDQSMFLFQLPSGGPMIGLAYWSDMIVVATIHVVFIRYCAKRLRDTFSRA